MYEYTLCKFENKILMRLTFRKGCVMGDMDLKKVNG